MSVDVNKTHPAAEDLSQQEASANQENPPVTGAEAKEDENSFEKLLEAYEGRTQSFSEGEVIKGRVIAISGSGVIVDVGFKSEGIIPIEQFTNDRGQVTIKAGRCRRCISGTDRGFQRLCRPFQGKSRDG